MTSDTRSWAASVLHLASARALTYLLPGVYLALLARLLGPELFGLLASSQAWYLALLPLTTLGLGSVMAAEMARRPGRRREILSLTLGARILAGMAAAVVCIAVGVSTGSDPEVSWLIALFGIALLGRSVSLWAEHGFTALERSSQVLRLEAGFRALELALGITAVGLGAGLLAVAVVHALGYWLQAAVALHRVVRQVPGVAPRLQRATLAPLLAAGMPVLGNMLLTAWMLQLPLVAYHHLTAGDAYTGQLAIILQALVILSTIPTAVGNASLPLLTHLAARDDGGRRGDLRALQLIGAILLAGILVAALATMLGPWLLPLLLGDAYREAGASIGFGLLGLASLGAAHMAAQGLFAHDRPRIPMLVTGAALLLGAVLFAPLVDAARLDGALAAVNVALAVRAALMIGALRRG